RPARAAHPLVRPGRGRDRPRRPVVRRRDGLRAVSRGDRGDGRRDHRRDRVAPRGRPDPLTCRPPRPADLPAAPRPLFTRPADSLAAFHPDPPRPLPPARHFAAYSAVGAADSTANCRTGGAGLSPGRGEPAPPGWAWGAVVGGKG